MPFDIRSPHENIIADQEMLLLRQEIAHVGRVSTMVELVGDVASLAQADAAARLR